MSDQQKPETPNVIQSTSVALSEVERLLATSDRLLKHQRDRLTQEEARYESMRTDILNTHRAQLAKIGHQTEEALTQLNIEYREKRREIERLVAKLTALREA